MNPRTAGTIKVIVGLAFLAALYLNTPSGPIVSGRADKRWILAFVGVAIGLVGSIELLIGIPLHHWSDRWDEMHGFWKALISVCLVIGLVAGVIAAIAIFR